MIEPVAVLALLSFFLFLFIHVRTSLTRSSQERQRQSNLVFLGRAHRLALGHEPEQPEGGDLLRSTVKLRGLGECVVETTSTKDLGRPVVFSLRVPRARLDLPDDLHFEVCVKVRARFARTFHTHWETPEAMWEAILDATERDASHRKRLLTFLLDDLSGTPTSEQTWTWLLEQGDVRDVAFAINHDDRALHELPHERAVAFLNELLDETKLFDSSVAPTLAQRRFDPPILLDASLSWGIRLPLLELWLNDLGADDAELLATLRNLPEHLTLGQRKDLEAALHQRPELRQRGNLTLSAEPESRGALTSTDSVGELSLHDEGD